MQIKLDKIVKDLGKEKFVKAIFLFGSYARGKATPISDIDLCVIDDEKYPRDIRNKAYAFSTDKISVSLFSDLPLYVKYEVLKGKPLLIKNKKFFKKLREKIVLDYLYTKHLWETHFEIRKKMGKWSIGTR